MTVVEVIAAVRNEERSLPVFVERVRSLVLPVGVELRMTFIEDSSDDGTLTLLRNLAAADSTIGFFSLVQGYGQGAAIVFGLSHSTADAVIMMDVDGSHPPEEISRMIALHLEGAEVVQCVRRSLTDRKTYRRIATRLFQSTASWLAGLDLVEQSIYYRLASKRIAKDLVSEPRYWQFLRFPLPRSPGQLAKLEIDTAERTQDESKYGPLRLIRLAIDAVLSLMSVGRASLLLTLVLGVALAFAMLGAWPIAIGLGLAAVWILRQYRALRSPDLLERMQVRESANVLAVARPA